MSDNPLKEFEKLSGKEKAAVGVGAVVIGFLLFKHSSASSSAATDTSSNTSGTADDGSTDDANDQFENDEGIIPYTTGDETGEDPWMGGGSSGGGVSGFDPSTGVIAGTAATGVATDPIGAGDISNPTSPDPGTETTGGGAPAHKPVHTVSKTPIQSKTKPSSPTKQATKTSGALATTEHKTANKAAAATKQKAAAAKKTPATKKKVVSKKKY